LFYDFTITNVGNDPTQFQIPNTAIIDGPGTRGNLIIDPDGTNTTITNDALTPVVQPGDSIVVRVPVTVDNIADDGDDITVQLGNATGQNQEYSANGGDVYTVDSPFGTDNDSDGIDDVTGEIDGDPTNGTREASDSLTATVGIPIQNQALATLLKTLGNHESNDPADLLDDQITYELNLRVESDPPVGSGVTPSDLEPTSITLDDTANTSRILVSDAIPANTELDGSVVPVAPADWTVVYTADLVTTDAHEADWYTDINNAAVGGAANVTRVGFVRDITMSPGQAAGAFRFTVVTNGYDPSSGGDNDPAIANIAQVFGENPNGDPVYDESGDQTPSNYDGNDGTFSNYDGTNFTPTDGYIDPTDTAPEDDVPDDAVDRFEIDPSDNQGTPEDGTGEVLLFSPTLTPTTGISNGPLNNPFAAGPTDTNDDFTNKATPISSGDLDNDGLVNPVTVPFTGTIALPGNAADTEVALLPTLPADLPGGTATDLPDDTIISIADPANPANKAYYQYDSAGGGSWTQVDSDDVVNAVAVAEAPIYVTVPDDQPINYGVEITLPAGTPISTEPGTGTPSLGNVLGGIPVPVTAYIDDDGNRTTIVDPADTNTFTDSNRTVFRSYTGFLQLLKESRLLQGSGPEIPAGQDAFSTEPRNPAPGNIIEYRVTYFNISESNAGTGNLVLNAQNILVTEDGTAGGNDWALDNDSDTEIDTSHVGGQASDSRGGAVSYFSGDPATNPAATEQSGTTVDTDITKYEADSPAVLGPQQSGAFTFQRQVN
ncbi:MAG: hypothetical protein AAF921_06370, partial [Cyanobacteria bacterium P01_D01_bin.44]